VAESAGRRERFDRMRHAVDGRAGSRKRFTLDVGFPAAGLDLPLGRPGQRPVQVHRRRRELDRTYDANAKGLPEKPYGRIALAVAPSKPQVVYATIEVEKQRTLPLRRRRPELDAPGCQPITMVWRPFYFANLIVDPKDENKFSNPIRCCSA
jgi:hypothetical protein